MNVNATLSAQQVAVGISVQSLGAALSGQRVGAALSADFQSSFSGPNSLSPTTVAGHRSTPFDGGLVWTDVNYDTLEYSNFKVVSRHTWLGRFDFPIPVGATITSATLRLTTSAGGDANVMTGRFYLVPKDGIWDDVGPNLSWRAMNDTTGASTEAWDIVGLMKTAGGVSNLSGGATLGVANEIPIKYDWSGVITDSSGIDAVSQTFLCTVSGDFRRLTIRLGRFGSPTGNVRVKMYHAMADDGTDDRPDTTTLLGTSADVVANTLSTGGTGADVNFDFPSDIAVTSGQRYAFVVEVDHGYGTAYVRAWSVILSTYTGGSACIFGKRYGVATCTYGPGPMWPHLYREDAATLHKPAFGSVLEHTIPGTGAGWGSGDVDFSVTTLVQEWVASPSYAPGTILVGIQPKDTSFLASRRFTSAQLLVTGFKIVPSVTGAVTAQRFNVVLTVG